MSDADQEGFINPESAWDVGDLPNEHSLFTGAVADAASEITRKNPLIQGGLEELEHPLDAIYVNEIQRIAALTGARVAVAALIEADMLKPDIAERLRTEHSDNGIPIFTVSEEMHDIIWGIEARANQSISTSEEKGK